MAKVHDYAVTLFETISTQGYAKAPTGTVVGNLSSYTNTIIDRLVKKADGKWYSLHEDGGLSTSGVFSWELYSVRYVVHNPNYLAGIDLDEEIEEEVEEEEHVVIFDLDGRQSIFMFDSLEDAQCYIDITQYVFPDIEITLSKVVEAAK